MESELFMDPEGGVSRLPKLSRRRLLFLAVVYEGGLFLAVWLVASLLGAGDLPGLELTPGSVVWGTALGLALLGAVYFGMRIPWRPIRRFRRDVERTVGHLFAECSPFDLAFISALAGISEEFVFRGWIQTGLSGSIGTWAAVGLGALLFGAAHAISLVYAIYATAVGVVLGVALVGSGLLWVPIVAHTVYDFGALTWLVRRRRQGRPGDPEDGWPGPEGPALDL